MKAIYIVLLSLFAIVAILVIYLAGSVVFAVGEAIVSNESPSRSAQDTVPRIEFLNETYESKYYLHTGFKGSEREIIDLLNLMKNKVDPTTLVPSKRAVSFEDGYAVLNEGYDHMFFYNSDGKFKYLLFSASNLKPANFRIEMSENKTIISDSFDSLNVNLLQNFIDYSNKDKLKRTVDTYTYELYDHEGNKRVEQKYHKRGEWFTFNIIGHPSP